MKEREGESALKINRLERLGNSNAKKNMNSIAESFELENLLFWLKNGKYLIKIPYGKIQCEKPFKEKKKQKKKSVHAAIVDFCKLTSFLN